MSVDCIKLTSYFGERHRTGGRFVADALLDLYGSHEIAASILLRGTEGFGLKHHLRTDRSLTLSEDLPLTAIAVDSRPRIEAVLGPTLELNRPGLVTLERARLFTGTGLTGAGLTGTGPTGEAGPGTGPGDRPGESKLTVYLGRQERVYRVPAFVAVCDLLHRPLLTLERVQVCKRDGRLLAPPVRLPAADEHGMALWHKLMIFSSEAAQHGGQPVHRALVRRLRSAGVSGATTLRGIWGFHGAHVPHGDRILQLGRHVPVVTIVIDTPERIATAFPIIDELTSEGGLVTSETIPALRAAAGDRRRGGPRLATHHLPGGPA